MIEQSSDSSSVGRSSIAVCICTCNRPDKVGRVLGVLSNIETSGLGPDIFIQIVDNAPDGRARKVCEGYRSSLKFDLKYAEEKQRGISFARNRAVAEALKTDAKLIAFIDDDDIPNPDWLIRLVEAQKETGSQIVFGFYEPLPPELLPNWMTEIDAFGRPKVDGVSRFGLPVWAATGNVLLTRDLLEATLSRDGVLFRPEFALMGSGDVDFFIRAIKAGARYATAPQSIIKNDWETERLTLKGVLRRAYQIGVSEVWLDRYHKSAYRKDRLKRLLSSPKLFAGFLRIPFLPPRRYGSASVALLFKITIRLGEFNALLGRRFQYYH